MRQAIARAVTTLRQSIAGALGGVTRVLSPIWRRVSVRLEASTQRFRAQTVTLSMESGQVRAVVFKGAQVLGWRSASLESASLDKEGSASEAQPPREGKPAQDTPEEGSDDMPAPPPKSELSVMLEEIQQRRSRLVADLPLYIPLMRHMRLPGTSKAHLEEIIHAEVVNSIPFDPFEVDINWLRRRDSAGHEVIAAAVPKSKMDTQVQLFEEAGGTLKAVYSKEAALAFAVGVPDVIIVHLERAQTAVVLVRDRMPRVVHQMEFPEGITSAEDQAEAVASVVDRVEGFYQMVDPEEVTQTLPVVLTGQLATNSRLAEALPRVLQGPVLPFTPSLDCPDDFPSSEYAANLGLFLGDKAKGKTWRDSGPVLNILPERYRPRPFPFLAIGVFIGLFLLAGLAFSVAGPVAEAVQDADLRSAEKSDKEAGERGLRLDSNRLRSTARDLKAADIEIQALETQLLDMSGSMADLLVRLETVTSRALPEGVELVSLVPQDGNFLLTGIASDSGEVLEYAAGLRQYRLFTTQGFDKYQDETGEYSANLRNELAFANATVQQVSEEKKGGVSFAIMATIPVLEAEE